MRDKFSDFKKYVPKFVHDKKDFKLYQKRHSAEHVLMQAMVNLYGTNSFYMAMGPATAEGFYFDFEPLKKFTLSEEDFEKIEKEMNSIISKDMQFTSKSISVEEARILFKDNPYKQEWLDEINEQGDKATVYHTGDPKKNMFVDLCKGPHVDSTKQIGVIKLTSIAGAYWRGDEKNKMLTRIYGTAFPDNKGLKKYLWRIEEAKKRDHRKLGKKLELFTFSEQIGPGLPLWLPNGTIIKDELEKWAVETEEKWGYARVSTPFMTKKKLFEVSGHVPYFEDEMYKVKVPGEDKADYFLRPMNCPFHHMVFKSKVRSYRDLPLRLAEYGSVARYEDSGSLNGILRPRFFVQNDAHVYCTEEQAVDVFVEIIELHRYYYNTLGLEDYYIVLALRDPKKKDKYHGEEKMWKKSEELSIAAMDKAGIDYIIENEGAAHYGPKMDFKIKSVIGTEYGISTNQIDLYMPNRFDLNYTDKDGKEKLAVVQHRAPLGSSERFVGFLIEHFAGAFPAWLSPEHVRIIPISDLHLEYAKKVKQALDEAGIRNSIDADNERMQKKVKQAQDMKVPFMLILGDKEMDSSLVSIRYRDGKQNNGVKQEKFIKAVLNNISEKKLNIELFSKK